MSLRRRKPLKRSSFRAGATAMLPILIGIVPFAAVAGLARALWRERWAVLGCVAVAGLAGGLLGQLQTPEYTAQSRVLVMMSPNIELKFACPAVVLLTSGYQMLRPSPPFRSAE